MSRPKPLENRLLASGPWRGALGKESRDLRSGPCPVTASCATLGKSLHICRLASSLGSASVSPKPLVLQFLSSVLLRPSSSRDSPRLSETPAFCSGGEAGKGGRESFARTRPGRPRRQGPFIGESGRGKSPGNPTVTWFPSRSRYRRAAEAPRRGQRSALRTAPVGCPSNTGTRVASLSPPEVTPAPGPARAAATTSRPPTLRHGPGHARGAATFSWRCSGPERTGALARVPAAAAASRLRAPSRSAAVPGGAAAAALRSVLRSVRPARSPATSSGAAGTRRRGRSPHLLRGLLPRSRRPARRDAAQAGGVAREPGRRVPATRRASLGQSPKS